VTLDAMQFNTYVWSTGDLGQIVNVDSTGTGIGTATIWCRVTNQYGVQSDTVRITFKDCSGISDKQSGISGLTVFPVPSSGEFNLSFRSADAGIVTIELVGFDGRIAGSMQSAVTAGSNQIRYDAGQVPSGLYMLRIKSSQGSSGRKVIVR
jgi:hypothetical protein